jgi:predicted negative regulator of RcsB-dependent stress response
MSQQDEIEQGERVRQWLRDNATSIIAGIALGFALIYGWHWKQGQDLSRSADLATQLDAVNAAAEAGELDRARSLAEALAGNDAASEQAALAALRVARLQFDAAAHDDARATLAAAIARAPQAALLDALHLRLAQVELAAGRHAEGLAALDAIPAGRFEAEAAELRGDLLFAQGQLDGAAEAYAGALAGTEEGSPTRRFLEIKLTEAGGRPAAETTDTTTSAAEGS